MKRARRPSDLLLGVVALTLCVGAVLVPIYQERRAAQAKRVDQAREIVAGLGLSDLALTNEARYTRHPAASDQVVMVMDHPGGIDRFPSTTFFTPPR